MKAFVNANAAVTTHYLSTQDDLVTATTRRHRLVHRLPTVLVRRGPIHVCFAADLCRTESRVNAVMQKSQLTVLCANLSKSHLDSKKSRTLSLVLSPKPLNPVTSFVFSNLYVGSKSMNTVYIKFFFSRVRFSQRNGTTYTRTVCRT